VVLKQAQGSFLKMTSNYFMDAGKTRRISFYALFEYFHDLFSCLFGASMPFKLPYNSSTLPGITTVVN
jgi:hypothetical protein